MFPRYGTKHGSPGARVTPFGMLAIAAVLFSTGDARAFCRSTTCRNTAKTTCPTDDDGCPSTGAKLFWPTSCLTFAMNARGTESLDPGQTRDVIRKSFATWSNVACAEGGYATLTFGEHDPVPCAKSGFNKSGRNVNLVMFQDNDWTYRGIDGTIAKTSVTFDETTGEIQDADIEVNAAFNTLTITDDPMGVEYDLQSVLTHEIGHFIGIAHSPDPTAVMYARYPPGNVNRELTPDDVDAVCAAYPPGATLPCNTEPVGGFGATCEAPVEDDGVCSVGAPGAPASDSSQATTVAFVLIGLGTIFAARASRRT